MLDGRELVWKRNTTRLECVLWGEVGGGGNDICEIGMVEKQSVGIRCIGIVSVGKSHDYRVRYKCHLVRLGSDNGEAQV